MNKRMYFISIVIVGIIVGSLGVAIWHSTYVQDQYDQKDTKIAELEADIDTLVKNQDLLTTAPDPEGLDPQAGLPVFIFTPGGLFTPEQKTSIETHLVDPYFAFYNEEKLVAATMNIEDIDSDRWAVTVINTDGSSFGFLYGDPTVDAQNWWTPDCFEECVFSNSFRGAFPEVVNKYQGL